MGIFRFAKEQLTAALGPIWPKFELELECLDLLVVHETFKNEEDPITNEGA